MTTFIIRRLIQGFFTLVVALFAIYNILIITPGGPADKMNEIRSDPTKHVSKNFEAQMLKRYKLGPGYPWPTNFLAWLFDPSETSDLNDENQVVPKGVDISIGGLHIAGSGVLTGDFGKSTDLAKGVPVLEMIGGRIGNTLILTTSSLLI